MRLFITFVAASALLALDACPAAKVPTGHAPEYEDPPAPSWLDGGAKGDAGAVAPLPSPLAPDAG